MEGKAQAMVNKGPTAGGFTEKKSLLLEAMVNKGPTAEGFTERKNHCCLVLISKGTLGPGFYFCYDEIFD